ncbi:MAG: hypothetical protein GXO07_02420 [Crenarchaeota archaeon]|nr:hypothetical protein [Thermoproteota archaeon]
MHAKKFCYKPVKKALRSAKDVESKEMRCRENALVIFLTIEKGDGAENVSKLLDDVKVHMERIKASSVVLYPYAHLSSELASPKDAEALTEEACKALSEAFGDVECAPFGWYKEFVLHVYGHPLAELSRRY